MRFEPEGNSPITDIWKSGNFLGSRRADTRITVDREWELQEVRAVGAGITGFHSKRQPARYYAESVPEVEEVPTSILRTVEITRAVSSDTAQLRVSLLNADPNGGPNAAEQGRFSPRRSFPLEGGGVRLIAAGEARWGDEGLEGNDWSVIYTKPNSKVHSYGMLSAGNMLRVYQGYGGADKPLADALDDGNLVPTGVFVINSVRLGRDGSIEITARDIGGPLLVDQPLYPPLIPDYCYPMQFYSPLFNQEIKEGTVMRDSSGRRIGLTGKPPTSSNYEDLSDIIRLICLWCGFHLPGGEPSRDKRWPAVLGGIENTGIVSEGVISAINFDKKPAIDAIKTIRDIVSYAFWIDQEGGVRFNSPNWWEAGNFDYDGRHHQKFMDIDEWMGLLDYGVTTSNQADRSSITVAMSDPYREGVGNSKIASMDTFTSSTKNQLHGVLSPAMWGLGDKKVPITLKDMITLAELTNLRIWWTRRQGSTTAPANPLLDIDDQIRVWERVTFELYIHRVQTLTTTHDLASGRYTMNIGSHWLGADNQSWKIHVGPKGHVIYNSSPAAASTAVSQPRVGTTVRPRVVPSVRAGLA